MIPSSGGTSTFSPHLGSPKPPSIRRLLTLPDKKLSGRKASHTSRQEECHPRVAPARWHYARVQARKGSMRDGQYPTTTPDLRMAATINTTFRITPARGGESVGQTECLFQSSDVENWTWKHSAARLATVRLQKWSRRMQAAAARLISQWPTWKKEGTQGVEDVVHSGTLPPVIQGVGLKSDLRSRRTITGA